MKNMKLTVLALIALSIAACGGHKVKLDSNNEVVVPGVVSVSTNWLKDKKDKFDFELVVTNKNLDTGTPSLIPVNARSTSSRTKRKRFAWFATLRLRPRAISKLT